MLHSRALTSAALAAALALPTGPARAAFAPEATATESGDLDRAKELFYEGSARYSAANYTGAIDSFTQALEIVTREGSAPDVRGALLLNLGRAYIKAYDVDADIRELRAAREIYARYLREAEPLNYPQEGRDEAQREHDALEARIAELEAKSAADPAPPPQAGGGTSDAATPSDDLRRNRRTAGYALVGVGSAFFLGALGPIIYAAAVIPKNIDEEIRIKMPTPEKEKAFRDQENLKKSIWLGVGAGMMVLGAAGIAAGAVLVVRNKKQAPGKDKGLVLLPSAGPSGAGLVLSGRF